MSIKDFLHLNDLSTEELKKYINTSIDLKEKLKQGIIFQPLKGKTLGMIFSKSSTRTRVSFETGIYQLGGQGIYLNQNDMQLGRGETIEDTGKVLSRYVDGIMIRTFSHDDVLALAKATSIPVINGLTDYNHPCQVLADFVTIQELKGRLEGIRLAYIGDCNNMAVSLIHGAEVLGLKLSIACPEDYHFDAAFIAKHPDVQFTSSPREAVENADVIYTDVWASMGMEEERQQRLEDFKAFQINAELCQYAKKDYSFLHCLPAHRGEECSAEIIDGEHSFVFDQAENRLHAQKAVMVRLMA